MNRKERIRYVQLICFMGIMTAMQFVTEYILSITIAGRYRISLTFFVRAITGYCIGWLGGIVSALTDVLGGFVFYGGSMNPGITFTRFLQGMIVGLILFRKSTTVRIIIASLIDNMVLTLFVTSFFLFQVSGTPYTVETLMPRAIVPTVSTLVAIAVLPVILPKLLPIVRKFMYMGIWIVKENKPVNDDVAAENVAEVTNAVNTDEDQGVSEGLKAQV